MVESTSPVSTIDFRSPRRNSSRIWSPGAAAGLPGLHILKTLEISQRRDGLAIATSSGGRERMVVSPILRVAGQRCDRDGRRP